MKKLSAAFVCLAAARKRNSPLLKHPVFAFLLFASAVAMPVASHAKVSIWLQSPRPGANPSKVLVDATATSSDGISGWAIYIDDAVAYQTKTGSNSLTQNVTLTNGRHLLYTRAWDSGGRFGTSATLMVQVGPAPVNNSTLPTPPANARVFTAMQNTTDDWKDCSVCAAGTHDTSNYWMVPFRSEPSRSGSSRELFAGGLPWTNVLFIKTMTGTSAATHFLWDFWVYHDPTSAANIWSAEFDLFHVLGGKEFMIGSQCDFGDGYWNTWDSANNRWIMDGIRCPRWKAATWHHIQWYVDQVSPTQYRYDTLVVDGKGYGINQTWSINPTSWPDSIGVQWQIDQSASGTPIHEWIDNVKLTTW